ncbi:glycosyltransferase [Maridesulfovibrio ferrireducens]|uniref:glycosyltransferase n=1 Tax=Maridesulfovibrio ferrireducens TaxID=246191 RepID=UPI001A1BED60|nr:glycosyltransferase [Maridesulfovibrio ferrireducens]MBI9112703.1 glycosyltransferase [Maridesulfovibrio ferrireducens]
MIDKKYDIGIIGNICSVDLNTAESLAHLGLKTIVFDTTNATKKNQVIDNFHKKEDILYDVYRPTGSLDFFRMACLCHVIFSYTGAILGPLKKIYPLKFLPQFPPIINISTGSDIAEFLDEKSIKSFLFRLHLNTSPLNWMVEYPHALKNIQKYKIKNVHFMPFPAFRLPENKLPLPQNQDKIIFLHPSHLDWQASDNTKGRTSTKGNDRFLKAFIRAVKNGLRAECVIIDRGSDRLLARELIEKSGVKDHFIWKKDLTRDDFFIEIKKCHVVVDQFDCGGLGGIAVEAMASGRPVMTYIETNCSRLQYGLDTPPIINCWSEDEIYTQIMNCVSLPFVKDKAEESYLWVNRQHRVDIVFEKVLFYVSLLTGKTIKDYGWLKTAYSQRT